jgi:hypothetical protein
MIDPIFTNEDALKTWLVDTSGNIAVSGAGIALLDSQITHLQSQSTEEFIARDDAIPQG